MTQRFRNSWEENSRSSYASRTPDKSEWISAFNYTGPTTKSNTKSAEERKEVLLAVMVCGK